MSAVIDKPELADAQLEADGRFKFERREITAAGGTAQLVFSCVGGPFALVQIALFDANDTLRDAVGYKGFGDPLITTQDSTSQWEFEPRWCPGGYVKWSVWPYRNAANLPAYRVTAQIRQQGKTDDAVVSGVVPDGQQMAQPFTDGIQVR